MSTDVSAHIVADEVARLRDRYLDLVQQALTHMLYRPLDIRWEIGDGDADYDGDDQLRAAAIEELSRPDFSWTSVRNDGRDWPHYAQTMVGVKRLENVRSCVERVIADRVPGDLIEAGVWRGGVVILMRAILDAFGEANRTVFAADSFCGLPPPNESEYPADAESKLHTASALVISRQEVQQNFELYGLLDERVTFLEGWFKDTLPTVKERAWSVVRLDGDLYESTMDGLTNLYPGLSVGGFMIIDDYTHDACHQAVSDFRAANGVDDPIEPIDWLGAFWRRVR